MTIRDCIAKPVLWGLCFAVAGLAPAPSAAHPHIFIDTGIELIHGPDGRVEAVRISWTYDELFSLLLLEDLGLDADYDGVLTEAETEQLQGFDMDWPDDWEGDVYAEMGGASVPLGPPIAGPAALLDNGMLTSIHTRALARPIDATAGDLVVKVYDPTFYTSYTILPEQVSSQSPFCTSTVFAPDLDEAYAFLEAALKELGAQIDDPFEAVEFPAVGDRFAEEVRLSCAVEG
ncbi:MAG: DUF1007 family protein [Pseudomonadota bacterium]